MHITNMFDITGREVRHRDTGGGSGNGRGTNTLPPPARYGEISYPCWGKVGHKGLFLDTPDTESIGNSIKKSIDPPSHPPPTTTKAAGMTSEKILTKTPSSLHPQK